MKNKLLTLPQYCLPQHFCSRTLGRLTQSQQPWLKQKMIDFFIRHYGVDMNEAAADANTYACFNDFFTRTLKPNARPLPSDPKAIVSPADGTISQLGDITQSRILQAKGHDFSVEALVGHKAFAAPFTDGQFITIYLSPKDYHRVHLPYRGELVHMSYIPGKLFSVNPRTTVTVPQLFARNERVVCHFKTSFGPMAVILVGAFFVASIATVWAGVVAPGGRTVEHISYAPRPFNTGDEIGRFQFGSTAIVLFPKDVLHFDPRWTAGSTIKMGQRLDLLS